MKAAGSCQNDDHGLQKIRKACVVCPASLVAQWPNEDAKFFGRVSSNVTWVACLETAGGALDGGTESAKTALERWRALDGRRSCAVLAISYESFQRYFASHIEGDLQLDLLVFDEGHRLKGGAAGRLFQELAQLDAEHRVLLTGTPLQNNLDELHHLLDFLDPAMLAATVAAVTHKKVADAPPGLASVVLGARELEQRRRADDDESADARLARLTAALRGRMLRRTKADVLRAALPGKRELVVRVELSAPQKALYRAVLTKNYDALAAEDRGRSGGAPPNLQNVVVQLRKVCDHCELMYDHFPDVCDGLAARGDPALPPRLGALLAGGGKLALLDAMLLKLRARGHRVLVFSQMTKMLDVLGEYCALRRFAYE